MFKKKEKTEKAPKNKKVRTMKVGTHKKSVLLLWAVLLASTSFGVYKNFTAIDTHTVHEKEIIQLRLNDTNGIENFVKNFAKAYYSWDTSKEAIEARTTEISKYLTKELQDLNADTIRTDIPTSVTVTNVLVWNVEQSGMNDFTVAYEVDQQVKEGEQTQAVTENYTVTVHVDKDGAMVITQNPTLAPAVQKSKYEPKVQEADVSVSSDTVKDATAFLETFFKLYPTATEKELEDCDKIKGFAVGGDDYVVKPFSVDELEARVAAHLRREKRHGSSAIVQFDNNIVIDYSSRVVFYRNAEINFTKKEFDIIEFLSQNKGIIFDRETIYEKVWGLDGSGDNSVITEHIRRIRTKFLSIGDNPYIETVWGCGYKWKK